MEFSLVIAGVQLGAFLVLAVQTVKFLGVTEERWLRISPVLAGLVFGILYGIEAFLPSTKSVIDIVFGIVVAVMTAVLGYGYIAAPVAKALGLKVSVADIEE